MEVVHAGPLGTADQIVRTAEQEDPDAVGLVGTGSVSLEELRDALAGVRLFVLGGRTAAENAENVFGSAEEAANWLAGGRSHTPGTPSDRAR
jgi:methylmalonyl-CoA mutase C-terminal domain/subunit